MMPMTVMKPFVALGFFFFSFLATTASSTSNESLGSVAASYPAVVSSLKLGDAEQALKETPPPWLSSSGLRKGRRPFGYPLGVCQPSCPASSSSLAPCPGFSCLLWPEPGSSNCTRVFYPGSRATRSATNCLPDFRRDCSSGSSEKGNNVIVNNGGCIPCALWHVISTKCAPFSAAPGGGDTNADDCAIVVSAALGNSPGFQANSTAIKELTTSTSTTSTPTTTKPFSAPLLQAAAKAASAALAFSLGEPFAVIPSRERGETSGNGEFRLCLTRAQVMIVPARPCTGADDDRAECTGARAEAFWEAAWLEALAAGFPPSPFFLSDGGETADDFNLDEIEKPTWAVVVNPSNRRSQHQTHLRIAPWSRDNQQLFYFGDVLQKWLKTDAFSLDASRPTMTTPESLPLPPDPNRPSEVQNPLIATVFVPLLSDSVIGKGMGWARPWETASVIAAAVDNATSSSSASAVALATKQLQFPPSPLSHAVPFVPGSVDGRPYDVLVAPWAQQGEGGTGIEKAAAATAATMGKKKKPLLRGFAVAAIFDIGSTQLLDERPTSDCFSRCAQWDIPQEKPALPLDLSKKKSFGLKN